MAYEDPAAGPHPMESVFGVMAHGLLNSMSVIIGSLATLSDHWARLDGAARTELIDRGVEQAQFVSDTLRDLVLGLPVGASSMLEELDVEAGRRRQKQV
ncbi:MAG: hypothetical protein NVS1B12_17300 [Acidimicrobiales bacterium]